MDFPFFSFKDCVVFSLLGLSPSPGGCRVCVCVCMQRVHAPACVQWVAHGWHMCAIAVPTHPLQRCCVPTAQPTLPTPVSLHSWLAVWAPPKHSQPCAGAGQAARCHISVPRAEGHCARHSLPAGPSSEQVTRSWKGLRHWELSQGTLSGLAQPRQSPPEPWGPSRTQAGDGCCGSVRREHAGGLQGCSPQCLGPGLFAHALVAVAEEVVLGSTGWPCWHWGQGSISFSPGLSLLEGSHGAAQAQAPLGVTNQGMCSSGMSQPDLVGPFVPCCAPAVTLSPCTTCPLLWLVMLE